MEGIISTSFEERIRNKTLSEDEARRINRELTGELIQNKGVEEGGMVVRFRDGTDRTFNNLAHLYEWSKQMGAVVYQRGENGQMSNVPLAGETVADILQKIHRKKDE